MPDLLDVSVWMPLSVPDHVHHRRALRYWEEESAEELVFCRITILALLRLLTNPRILDEDALSAEDAWRALRTWLAVPHVRVLSEPAGLDEWLGRWAQTMEIRAGEWTDAYLAAFAAASGCRLVAFDAAFRRFPEVQLLHLRD